MSLSLVFHELATNAAKYGSLSVPGGRVEIDWSYDTPRRGLQLRWAELGGPPASPPAHLGFGTKLMTSIVGYNLDGSQEQYFGPDGFSIDLFIPLASMDVPVTEHLRKSETDHADHGAGG